jgi:hypothetical protein
MTVSRTVVTLTGYAYETVPNKPILAGQMSGSEVASTVDPKEILTPARPSATLGALALGFDSLEIWRREEEVGMSKS